MLIEIILILINIDTGPVAVPVRYGHRGPHPEFFQPTGFRERSIEDLYSNGLQQT